MTTYHVLRTIAADGAMLIDRPVAERVMSSHNDYGVALCAARELRTATYVHKVTGERRVYTELQIAGCAYRDDQTVWEFVRCAEWQSGGYAIVVEDQSLAFYEPKGGNDDEVICGVCTRDLRTDAHTHEEETD